VNQSDDLWSGHTGGVSWVTEGALAHIMPRNDREQHMAVPATFNIRVMKGTTATAI